ncbi:hypothetical protein B0H19DRAFT_1298254 [Mycena capillaripes]|nr:hypothetical protein B0H19DRAFT_1298254 [Mycena capillaripes]
MRYRDEPPAPPTVLEPPVVPTVDNAPPAGPNTEEQPPKWVKTEPNIHGLYKNFPNRPTHDPDESVSLDDLCKSSELLVAPKIPSFSPATPPWFPFLNTTVARLIIWFHIGSNLKSIAELDSLVEDVLMKDDFDREHLKNFGAARENKRLDDTAALDPDENSSSTKWNTASIKIKLPAYKVCGPESDAAGLLYRPLLDVMIEAFQSPAFEQFHTTPFQYRWDQNHDPDDPDVMYGEVYTSRPMLKAHHDLPLPTATPHLETIIAVYMFWSDSTHLANFGNASLWPLDTFFGNLSKYTRAKPSANAGYHPAYFPSVRILIFLWNSPS